MAKINGLTAAEQAGLELEFAEEIHAGFPSPAAEHAGERIDIVREMSRHPETTFYAMVSGESMRDAGLQDGDIIAIDIPGRKIELKVSDAELEKRRKAWVCPEPRIRTGYLSRYAKLVSSADRGAVLE